MGRFVEGAAAPGGIGTVEIEGEIVGQAHKRRSGLDQLCNGLVDLGGLTGIGFDQVDSQGHGQAEGLQTGGHGRGAVVGHAIVDHDGQIGRQAKKARARAIAARGMGRDRTDFHGAETQRRQGRSGTAAFVKAGSQADGIFEVQPGDSGVQARIAEGAEAAERFAGRGETSEKVAQRQGAFVDPLGVAAEENGADTPAVHYTSSNRVGS